VAPPLHDRERSTLGRRGSLDPLPSVAPLPSAIAAGYAGREQHWGGQCATMAEGGWEREREREREREAARRDRERGLAEGRKGGGWCLGLEREAAGARRHGWGRERVS
jgi:hypothetical protein